MLRHDFKRIIYSYGFYIAVALFVVMGILQQLSYTDGKPGCYKRSALRISAF